jgi:adenine deaminase
MEENSAFSVTGVLVDPVTRTCKGVEMIIENKVIAKIKERPEVTHPYILPGFVDAHVHVESSMLIPSRFAVLAVRQGTIGVVTDPHEVANVAGIGGVEFMINDGKTTPLGFFFGAPSCVPASPLEKSGAYISGPDVEELLKRDDFYYLSEMMNFPGVIYDDSDVWHKLNAARRLGKPVDGHAPGLSGSHLKKYAEAGISTDHECSTIEEATEKLGLGMKILIREGSAARNFENLVSLIKDYKDQIMFCTDDCHPDYLMRGHINKLVSRAVKMGHNLFDVLQIACVNPIKHYGLPIGFPAVGQKADFILVDDLIDFNVVSTYISGEPVYSNGNVRFATQQTQHPTFPFRKMFEKGNLQVIAETTHMNVIQAMEGELVTEWEVITCEKDKEVLARPEDDLLKLVLLDRYSETPPVVAFIKGFGLHKGALACSIAHDSHHIIAVGCDDHNIDNALEWIVNQKGGLCISHSGKTTGIALPYFGLMTDANGTDIALDYEALNKQALDCGSKLQSPFMTLSFMALTVIPKLKINHNGLFDGIKFQTVPLFV